MRAQFVIRARVWSCFGVTVGAVVPLGVPLGVVMEVVDLTALLPFCVPFGVAVVPFCVPFKLVEGEAAAADSGNPSSTAAARRTSSGFEEMRSSGQNEGSFIPRRACRAQVRQRFEPGGAEGEGASHLGLNWIRVDDIAIGGVSLGVLGGRGG